MNALDLFNAIALLKRLYDQYETNPTAIACDLLTLVSRVSTLNGVRLDAMLDAVKKGAKA